MSNPLARLFRFAFHQLYNQFAFTYDKFSDVVSRGEWWTWTRAGIPFLRGTRILEVASGSGNLHLDLYDAGYVPIGVDLSPYMLEITRRKFNTKSIIPRLARANAKRLPFPSNFFTSLMMTFPPGFVFDVEAMRELWRVLEPQGILIWVDAPYLYSRDLWSRMMNAAYSVTGVGAKPGIESVWQALHNVENGVLMQMWDWRVQAIENPRSRIHVFLATKRAY